MAINLVVDDSDLPADYERCGTCGFDHAYDGDYPGIREKINEAHMDKLKRGDRVTFRGQADEISGGLLCATEDGPDTFEAVVVVELMVDDTYCLDWVGGAPVGIPFHRRLLTKKREA